jgi:large subunit ribosomal protein L31e
LQESSEKPDNAGAEEQQPIEESEALGAATEGEVIEEEVAGEEMADQVAGEEEQPIEDASVEEEAEELPRRPEEEEERFVEERIYTIPLRRAWIVPAKKRAPRAIRIIRAFVQRHMKLGETALEAESEGIEGGRIIISNEVNEEIWSRGVQKPPRKLRIRAAKDEEGNVTIFLA